MPSIQMKAKLSLTDFLSVTVAILLCVLKGFCGSKTDMQSISFQRCGPGSGGQTLMTLRVRSRLECLKNCAKTSSCLAASVVMSHPPGTVTCHLYDEDALQCGQPSAVGEIFYSRKSEQSVSEAVTAPASPSGSVGETSTEASSSQATTLTQPSTSPSTTSISATTQTTAEQTTQTTQAGQTQSSTASATTTSVMSCENGGTLTAGNCACVQGFAGTRCERRWRDCTEGQQLSGTESLNGFFFIQPSGAPAAFEVRCTEDWTRIHLRVPTQNTACPNEDFYRSWSDYKNGFGSFPCSFWLGNEKLYYLTNQGNYELTVRTQFSNDTGTSSPNYRIDYSSFRVESEANGYRLLLGSPLSVSGSSLPDAFDSTGSTTQSMQSQKFGTYDRDVFGCANATRSGWWFNTACSAVNLNVPEGSFVATHGGSQRLVWPLGQPNSSARLVKPAMAVVAVSYN